MVVALAHGASAGFPANSRNVSPTTDESRIISLMCRRSAVYSDKAPDSVGPPGMEPELPAQVFETLPSIQPFKSTVHVW